jgi:hypothetical protein
MITSEGSKQPRYNATAFPHNDVIVLSVSYSGVLTLEGVTLGELPDSAVATTAVSTVPKNR